MDQLLNILNPIFSGEPDQRGNTNIFGDNPTTLSLAGMLMMSGVPMENAFVKAAELQQGSYRNALEKQKMQKQQQQLAVAADILRKGGGLADLLGAGVDNPAILGSIPQAQWIPDPTLPGGGQFVNPPRSRLTGENGAMPNELANAAISGNTVAQAAPSQQGMSAPMAMGSSPAERKSAIKTQERRTKEMDDWRTQITNEASKAGAIISSMDKVKKIIPKMFHGDYAENKLKFNRTLGLDEKAVSAHESFNKIVSQVVRDMEADKAGGRTDAARDLIIATKPMETQSELGKLSATEAIQTYAKLQREKAIAVKEWTKKGGDKDDFEIMWNQFQEQYPSIDWNAEKGLLQSNEKNLKKWREVIFGEPSNESRSNVPSSTLDEQHRQMVERIIAKKRKEMGL